jgi:hypothetical protein
MIQQRKGVPVPMTLPTLDWSQVSIGAVGGGVLTWVGAFVTKLFEHYLEGKKQEAVLLREIRAEERAEHAREKERGLAKAEALGRTNNELLLLKTRLRGATELVYAGDVVKDIHGFFAKNPQYLSIRDNKSFLERYPESFKDDVHYAVQKFQPNSLALLKADADLLKALQV